LDAHPLRIGEVAQVRPTHSMKPASVRHVAAYPNLSALSGAAEGHRLGYLIRRATDRARGQQSALTCLIWERSKEHETRQG
jgi:hypothetical protein